ncbi:hypothetical protein T4C_2749 [Trichinella pseudospiralis]|uniref:Uncharacterized protein n=1 Tax=Trichinella pseudospiralis TaxID=6337 RepID=A0A0V1I9P1_TRIPS|nr:hypothetical protein T4C_2749 [Trichinella pseudospiralis]
MEIHIYVPEESSIDKGLSTNNELFKINMLLILTTINSSHCVHRPVYSESSIKENELPQKENIKESTHYSP